jgi:aconitate hydratase
VPTVIFAGKEYGTGSSRDWAAKGTRLLGVRAVIAESFERIHRSNLVGMGVVPLELTGGATVQSLGITGHEVIDVIGLGAGVASGFKEGREVTVRAAVPAATDPESAAAAPGEPGQAGRTIEIKARVRLDTPQEVQYFRHGGILHYVLRQLLSER